jgi:M6 family metalloprotease-like protein
MDLPQRCSLLCRFLGSTIGSSYRLGTTLALVVLALATVLVSTARALDVKSFGWNAKPATGTRPLLVIWVRPPDDTPAGVLEARKRQYENLAFGQPRHAGTYPDRLRELEPSIVDYYRDASGGKFAWSRAGFVGPLNAPVTGKSDGDIARLALAAAAAEGKVDFRKFDLNHDDKLSPGELTILVISNNVGAAGGTARHFGDSRMFKIPGQGIDFAGGDGVVREGGAFAAFTHELFHTVGGIDRYGPWHGCLSVNDRLSLMSANVGGIDDERTVQLDAWHKMLAGWIEPRLVAIGSTGRAQLAAQHVSLNSEPERKRPLLIYDPRNAGSEYVLLEYRTPDRLGYDRDLTTSGLIIWHVLYDRPGHLAVRPSERPDCQGKFPTIPYMVARGAPNWQQGGNKAWTSANGEIAIKWADGRNAGTSLTVAAHKSSDPAIEVAWAPRKTPPLPRNGPATSTGVSIGTTGDGGRGGVP